nr:MAG TPA: hypothetical protein [Crassvirales sp.]
MGQVDQIHLNILFRQLLLNLIRQHLQLQNKNHL